MRWPWRRCPPPLPQGHEESLREAARRLKELHEQRPRVVELERRAREHREANHFTERITRGLGGMDA